MPDRIRLVALTFLLLVLGAAPLHAQEADSLAADTTVADTMATDTTTADTMAAETAPPKTTVQDTGYVPIVDTIRTATDTIQVPADSVISDSLAAIRDSIWARRDSMQARRDSIRATRTQKARAMAESWLETTDDGRFDESWDVADSTLQARISRDDWVDQGRRARNRLDTMRSRTLTHTAYRDSMARVPGADPVVLLQYATTFDRGDMLEALVTTRRDTTWKVAGYRVVPVPDTTQTDTTTEESDTEDNS